MRNFPLPLLALVLFCGFAARIELAEVDLIAPADDSEVVALAPTFQWSPVEDAVSYEIQVSTRRNMRQPVIETSGIEATSFTPSSPLDEETDYYWRARAIDAQGSNGPWSSVWSFETGQLPGQVNLSLPLHQSTIETLSPLFVWLDQSLASEYRFELSTDSDFGSLVYDTDGVATPTLALPVTLDANTRYYWRVRASNTVGDGPYSDPSWFETLGFAPSQVSLEHPSNGDTGIETDLTFEWAAADGASSYRIEVSGTSNFSTLLIDENGITSTSYDVPTPLLNGAQYYWRVRATNLLGDGPVSAVSGFTTEIGGAAQVSLTSPADESQDVQVSPTLRWQAVAGAPGYRVQVSTRSDFAGDFVHDTVVGSNQFQAGPLALGMTYHWRVRASNTGVLNWSEAFSFSTGASAPAQVVLVSPADGAADQPLELSLTWAASDLADTYNLQIGLDEGLGTLLLSETGLTGTSFAPEELEASTTHYWRVQGVNGAGVGPWSSVRQFTTRFVSAPAAPTLIYPPDGAEGIVVNPVMSWNAAEGADSYKLELSTSPPDDLENFVTVVTAVVVAQPFFQAPDLQGGQLHYWRVEARNQGGSSRSTVRSFSTAAVTDVESDEIPSDFALEQNYPNPFNPTTRIRYALAKPSSVRLDVSDVSGKRIATLVSKEQPAGVHEVLWDGRADDGSHVASGVYLYRLSTPEYLRVRRMVVAK